MHPSIKRFLYPLIAFCLLCFLWEGSVYLFGIKDYILPAPHQIFIVSIQHVKIILINSGITIIEAFSGLIIGNALAILTAIIFAHSQTVKSSFYPYIIALKTTPIIAIAPLIVLWFGGGLGSRIVIVALICFFPGVVNTIRGLGSFHNDWLDIMNSIGATKWQIFKEVRLKFALPYIFSAIKISSTFSVVGAIIGEFIIIKNGLGYTIIYASFRNDTAMMFAGIIASAIIGLSLFGAISFFEQKFLYWYGSKVEEN